MPIITTAISGSGPSNTIAITGSIPGFVGTAGQGNKQTINVSTTVPDNHNSLLYGPITIGTGGTLIISGSSNVKIKDLSDV